MKKYSDIYKEELIHDKEVLQSISFRVIAKMDSLHDQIQDIKECGFAVRHGKRIEEEELEKLLHDLEVEFKALEEVMKPAEKYKRTV